MERFRKNNFVVYSDDDSKLISDDESSSSEDESLPAPSPRSRQRRRICNVDDSVVSVAESPEDSEAENDDHENAESQKSSPNTNEDRRPNVVDESYEAESESENEENSGDDIQKTPETVPVTSSGVAGSDDSGKTIDDPVLQSLNNITLAEYGEASQSADDQSTDVDDTEESLEISNAPSSSEPSPQMPSPPLQFSQPLARSSLLPVPKNLYERSVIQQPQPVKPSVRLIPVPSKLLLKPQPVPEVIDLNSGSDDDVMIEDSIEERVRKTNVPATPKTVVEESDASSSAVSLSSSSSLTAAASTSAADRLETIQNQIRAKMSASNKSAESDTSTESQSEYRQALQALEQKKLALRNLQHAWKNCDPRKLRDGGLLLQENMERCRCEVQELERRVKSLTDSDGSLGSDSSKTSVKQGIAFSIKDQQIANLGKKGMETHRVEKALTMDALVSLHSSLATTPAPGAMAEPPDGLSVTLMPHQLEALAWLLHRENQNPSGGILADDMGLGKTLTMIALVMQSDGLKKEPPKWQSSAAQAAHPGKTLVVCPASLIGQWEGQVKQHVKRGRLSTLMHHGTNRDGRGRSLTTADIVITTYGVVAQENKSKGALFRVAWQRIILDEAHQIRNHKTMQAVACCELLAKYRWCLTGTPIHNKELDVYSLLKFLRCSPFDDLNVWKRWVDNKTPTGTERLNTVMKSILLRRTKEDLKKQGALKDLSTKDFHDIRLDLDSEERKVYENVLNFSKTLFAQYLQQRAESHHTGGLMSHNIQKLQSRLNKVPHVKTHDILVLLLRLRQICSLPGLIHAMLEEDAAAADGFEKEDPAVEAVLKQVRRLTIGAPAPEPDLHKSSDEIDKILFTSNPVFNMKRQSSKIKIAMKTLKNVLTTTSDKIVVVSQWAGFLRHLEEHLKMAGIKSSTLDGSIPVKNRGALVDVFNDPKSSVRVFLLSLTAGGVGLNLIGGSHLIIMEPHWNPQLESQACDRVYRVGQKKPVNIYKVICKDTIEERIEQLQIRKLALAQNVLTGQLSKEINKLTVQDLKSLFGMD